MGPVGHLLALYRARVGGDVAPASLSSDAPLDVVAARDEEKQTLSLGLINYSPKQDVAVSLDIRGGWGASRRSGAGASLAPGWAPSTCRVGPSRS